MLIDVPNYYLFAATFEDGTQIIQDESDVSSFDSKRSQFTDVLSKSEESKLISFVLFNNTTTYGVDLLDGHFEVNGIPFFPYRIDREEYKDFQIIYLRNVRHDYIPDTGAAASYLGYTLGFQANTADGSSVQHIMKIVQ